MVGGASGDYISCGPENDIAVDPQAADLLDRGCNDLIFNYGLGDATTLRASAYPVAARHGALTFAIGCPRPEELDGECAAAYGTLKLRDSRGKLMGSGVLTRRAGRRSAATRKPARVTVRLNGHGRYRLALRNGTGATLSLRGHNLPSARWTVALRRVR
jgi:hypothetical protein